MSTRCQIAFYRHSSQAVSDPSIILYRHWDGYPEGVLPDLVPFLREYPRLSDVEYSSARTLEHLMHLHTDRILGYGVSDCFHGDIEYVYAVRADERRLEVYERVYLFPGEVMDPYDIIMEGGLALRQIEEVDLDGTG